MEQKEICVSIPKGQKPIHSYCLFQLPESNLAWLHFLDKNDKDVRPQIALSPGYYTLIGKTESAVILNSLSPSKTSIR